ncbi:TAXI family TRAP transporter solute-binding subunit [Hoeflea prorocentri]|uniref:TAXI family TRAP transporter solute-binding subunit n=2 Tax=Hoeflea prorocentri TaxID=1922333 RepID=A0A9X3UIA6_9HYPH|nr:TAXI family TRAP transporter solute-binding subunit [Hoeflea prorocentri]MDA5399642.1 TAXI family TRAP transporter solute-binding subunit [Hoeflea prorocentri]
MKLLTNRRMFLKGTAAAGIVAASGVPAFARDGALRWGSSSLGSSGYVILEAMANVTNKHTNLHNAVQATAGTTENFALLGSGELDIAHTTSIDWVAAFRGDKPYPGKIEANQLLSYVKWLCPPLVHKDSDIQTIADLKGRKYSASKPGSGAAALSRILLESAGLGSDGRDVDWVYGGWKEVYNNFQLGQVDCIFGIFTNGAPIGLITQVNTAVPLRALEYSQDVLDAAIAKNPGILVADLTPEDWSALEKPVRSPVFTGILGAATSVSAEDGYEIVKSVLDNVEEVKSFGKPLAGVGLEAAVNNLLVAYPVNAGAAQYYKEKGVWRDELKIAS